MKFLPTTTVAVAVALAAISCKDNEQKEQQPAQGTNENGATQPTSVPQVEAPEVPPPPAPLVVGEEAGVLFQAADESVGRASWTVTGRSVLLEARIAQAVNQPGPEDGKPLPDVVTYDIDVLATTEEGEPVPVFQCKGLNAQRGVVQVLSRGDHVHMLCVSPPAEGDLGSTTAGRFRFDTAAGKLAPSGTYGGEGIVDPDTIDLDEE